MQVISNIMSNIKATDRRKQLWIVYQVNPFAMACLSFPFMDDGQTDQLMPFKWILFIKSVKQEREKKQGWRKTNFWVGILLPRLMMRPHLMFAATTSAWLQNFAESGAGNFHSFTICVFAIGHTTAHLVWHFNDKSWSQVSHSLTT